MSDALCYLLDQTHHNTLLYCTSMDLIVITGCLFLHIATFIIIINPPPPQPKSEASSIE